MNFTGKVCSRFPQRYILAVMCMFGFLLSNLNRFFFILIMKEMFYSEESSSFYPPCSEETHVFFTCGKEQFFWGDTIKRRVQSAWMYGSILGLLPLALLTGKYGAKTIFGFSIFVPGICSAITPLCARNSPEILIFVRVIGGFSTSSQYVTQAWMAARWFPLRHRGLLLSVVYAGCSLGLIFPLLVNNLIITVGCKDWATVCYVYAGITMVFAYLWKLLIWDDPFDHPYISDDELLLLVHVNEPEHEPSWRWPWISMVKSKGLWMLAIAYVGQTCFFTFASYGFLIVYFPEVQGYCFINYMGMGTVIFLARAAGMIVGGAVGDWVVFSRHWLNMTQLMKTYLTINCILGPLLLISVTHAKCDLSLALFLFIGALVCEGIAFGNATVACLHMASNYVAATMALTAIPALVIPPILFKINIDIISKPIKDSWETATYFNAMLSVFTTAIFLKYGKIEPQPWNEPRKVENEADEGSGSVSKESANLSSKNPTENTPLAEDEPGDKSLVQEKRSKHSQTSKSRSDIINRKGKDGDISNQNTSKGAQISPSMILV